jgi:hypothetical protein
MKAIAVPGINNCSAHVTDDVIPLHSEERVDIIVFAIGATQILHFHDLPFFDVLKRCPGCELPFCSTRESCETAPAFGSIGQLISHRPIGEPVMWG